MQAEQRRHARRHLDHAVCPEPQEGDAAGHHPRPDGDNALECVVTERDSRKQLPAPGILPRTGTRALREAVAARGGLLLLCAVEEVPHLLIGGGYKGSSVTSYF